MESHNIANQAFNPSHEGMKKVDAIQEMVPWHKIDTRDEYYEGQEPLHDIVFLLTDTMKSRKEIFNKSIKLKQTQLMIETRMGSNMGIIYSIDPRNAKDIRYWNDMWYPDDKAEVSACGAQISVGPTADLISGYAVWQFMNWVLDSHKITNRQILFSTQETTMLITEQAEDAA